jgi:hypothetical protein
MLTVVTLAAIGAAVATYLGSGFAWRIVLVVVGLALLLTAPLCFGTLALYCRGHRQTFFIGAFVGSAVPMLHLERSVLGGWMAMAAFLLVNIACALGSGWLAVATRRFAERRGWHLPPDEGNQ